MAGQNQLTDAERDGNASAPTGRLVGEKFTVVSNPAQTVKEVHRGHRLDWPPGPEFREPCLQVLFS